jgi:hypothetical protein
MIDVLQFCAAQCTHCYDASHLEENGYEYCNNVQSRLC